MVRIGSSGSQFLLTQGVDVGLAGGINVGVGCVGGTAVGGD